ncbi:hypothetical protein POSPLADRAFT_1070404 [Postia placenta MAD-698-R-SB12]|uniref:Phosphodiesterase n=1 Tax=Postia placenta MAD-698-R-SB12 TaxID=670580 RepID=A0A1X6MWQ2_9APHY|nr:hypothetical protein POSPLADRAFT_1070404 [Postia placenta MAD-698-R-SB12]OSX60788.1 hypothetical protein POSPLADRAFT_1070404 [Postia placenta MAD-698-R-SB12]
MNDAAFARRRSVDVGGLALALADGSSGQGWGGWDEAEAGETKYAEVLIDVRAHTETIINYDTASLALVVEDGTRYRLIHSLCTWNFEPHKLPEEEVLACSYILFEALYRIEGMQDAVGIPLCSLASFLQHLRQVYRQGNTYHNFQHALDVFQATYYFLYRAGMVPPVSILLHADARTWQRDKDSASSHCISRLTPEDIFALLIAAVGHDVGHPGLTNAFMKNARTPLAVVYDDKSVLEQMHYSLILQIMRHNGLGSLLDRPHRGAAFRRLLLGTVLATDLSLHGEFMDGFRALLEGNPLDEQACKILLCQALIKCADISNPCRPYSVSKHWVAALESEWTSQLMLERHLHLPATVKPSDDSLEMEEFALQCRGNLARWEVRSTELSAAVDADARATVNGTAEPPSPTSGPAAVPQFQLVENFLSAFPPTLPDSFRSSEDAHSLSSSPPSHPSSRYSHSHSASGSSGSSHYESCESGPPSPWVLPSPAASDLQPRLEIATPPALFASDFRFRPPSAASVRSASTAQAHDATAAIRAAYKASVRKKKSWHRSSWNPGGASSPGSGAPLSPTGPSPLTAHSSPMTTHSHSPLTPLDAIAHDVRTSPLKECGDPTSPTS